MNNRPYYWSGPICGLGNRLIALAAVKACAGERTIHFPWSIDPSCPGGYGDILKPMQSLQPRSEPLPDSIRLQTHGWEPLTIHSELNTALNLNLSQPDFCRRLITELRSLPFQDDLTASAKNWRRQTDGSLIGVHIRRSDRTKHHRDQFRAFLMRKQGMNRELPLHLNALYGLCPTPVAHVYEDIAIANALRKYAKEVPDYRYAIFSDTAAAEHNFSKSAALFCISKKKHIQKKYPEENDINSNDGALRQTTIREAVSDLLCLAQSDAIAQSNRASTFSLVAALIGGKPIITANSRYPFWVAIKEAALSN